MTLSTLCKRRPHLAFLASLALCLSACGGSSDSPSPAAPGVPAVPSAPAASAAPYTLAQTGAPIDVTVSLDSSRAVSQDLPLTGGTVTATGADGSTYTLEVPANALVQATRITLTPVQQVTGLPVGETGATRLGVQFEPSGLAFVNPATLIVTPAAAAQVPVDRQLFIQWQDDGRNLAFAAPDPSSSEIRLQVLHFSGMGVVRSKGLDADTEPVRQRIGGDAERRIQSAVAEALSRDRQRQLLGVETGSIGDVIPAGLLEQYQREVVQPRIAAAGSSCAAGRLALQTVLGLERQRQLLGISDDSVGLGEAGGLMPVVAEVCMKEEFEICRDEHVLTRIVPARIGLERQAQLLGLPDGSFAYTDRYVEGCLKFELDFLSTAGGTTDAFDWDEGVQALKVRLALNGPILQGGRISGSVALQSMYYDVRSKRRCVEAVEAQRVGSTLEVSELVWGARGEEVSDFLLQFNPGLVQSNFKVRNTCSDPPQTAPGPVVLNFSTAFTPARLLTAASPTEFVEVKEWSVRRGEVLAIKAERLTYQVDAKTSFYADSRWELRHAPGL